MSLQPVKKAQMMLPDSQGILRPHQLRSDTIKFIETIVRREEQMDTMSQNLVAQSKAPAIPSPAQSTSSIASAPSTSSVASGASNFFAPTPISPAQRCFSQIFSFQLCRIHSLILCKNIYCCSF